MFFFSILRRQIYISKLFEVLGWYLRQCYKLEEAGAGGITFTFCQVPQDEHKLEPDIQRPSEPSAFSFETCFYSVFYLVEKFRCHSYKNNCRPVHPRSSMSAVMMCSIYGYLSLNPRMYSVDK